MCMCVYEYIYIYIYMYIEKYLGTCINFSQGSGARVSVTASSECQCLKEARHRCL